MKGDSLHVQVIVWSLVATILMPEVCLAQSKPSSAIVTQLAWRGDDAVTQRFRAALQAELESSPNFDLSPRPAEEMLRLFIPTHLYWSKAQERTNFQYVVILTNQDSKYFGVSIGSCWEEDMPQCVRKVLRDAGDAWSRRRNPQPWVR